MERIPYGMRSQMGEGSMIAGRASYGPYEVRRRKSGPPRVSAPYDSPPISPPISTHTAALRVRREDTREGRPYMMRR